MKIKSIIELKNGQFADLSYEGGSHIYIRGVTDFTEATMYDNQKDLEDIYCEMVKFNDVGFGFEPHHSEWQFSGECVIPKRKRQVELVLK